MTTLTASTRAWNGLIVVVLFSIVLAPIPYFIAFLFAYGFSMDPISPAQHMFFLAGIACVTLAVAAVASFVVRATSGLSPLKALVFSIWASLAVHLTVVGIGSIVSAYYADQNSVTAEYSLTTDILLASGLLGTAAVAGWLAFRARPR